MVWTHIHRTIATLTQTLIRSISTKKFITSHHEGRRLCCSGTLTPYERDKNEQEDLMKNCEKKCPDEIMDPKNKVALITGGTSGIGFQTANELLCNGACHVILTGIDDCAGKAACEQLNASYGSKSCSYIHLNVISSEDFKGVFKYAERKFGSIDILFNNAGILEDKKWELEVETNMKSIIRSNIIGLKHMSKYEVKTPRIIINMSDVCALGALPPAPVYTATSYGVLGITKCFGSKYHYNDTGVRVVALCCGATRTNLIKTCNKKQLTEKWSQDTFETLTARPLQKADVVGKAVLYLIRFANSNTIWTVENSHLYKTKLPKMASINSMIKKLC
ncbi:hypothetical protein LSTR_LSTR004900 [Laodelphax striatellus]|uniref:Uncharacterized protein n=1 Tax=Laodelphax striatellus TaxID=195883 RepID=A0A482XPV3_LAOST|nr:hypothetical protein LSTR_LSTR004900 [Laodelphax striatellus]